jgi:hypothetical protein
MLQYEHFVLHEELGKKISSPPVQSGGCINLPDAPGLGVETDESAIRLRATPSGVSDFPCSEREFLSSLSRGAYGEDFDSGREE